MPKFVRFKEASGEDIWIRPEQVKALRPAPERGTVIYFTLNKQEEISVIEPVDKVITMLTAE